MKLHSKDRVASLEVSDYMYMLVITDYSLNEVRGSSYTSSSVAITAEQSKQHNICTSLPHDLPIQLS